MIIPNFPDDLLEEHRRWHHANHVGDNSNPPVGWGDRFLSFHRQYIRKVLTWYQSQGYDMNLVQPWSEVPQGIRMSRCYDVNAEMRVRTQPQSFATSDDLGRYIERLHACIHDAGSDVLNERILQDLDIAPRSTYFYNIHGMIDNWYSNWQRAQGGSQPQPPFGSPLPGGAPVGFPGLGPFGGGMPGLSGFGGPLPGWGAVPPGPGRRPLPAAGASPAQLGSVTAVPAAGKPGSAARQAAKGGGARKAARGAARRAARGAARRAAPSGSARKPSRAKRSGAAPKPARGRRRR
ncbi:hypothetical protein HGI30_20780 [Paenibacillus albicereus]|uniref:Uncharacterized protein n=1 Tax=Paenibacillus albicereus TaxID=2726185 RepID=A0A6H2H305_9BACL|nr:hypothetical protein [Paenibacillus albicereus]QJC53718.1 hypothetical protein HGI30_20780 [Paenibacillus albicereus]